MKTADELLKQVEAFKVAFWELQCDLHVTIGETKNKELRSIQRTLFSIGDSVRQLPPLPDKKGKWQGQLTEGIEIDDVDDLARQGIEIIDDGQTLAEAEFRQGKLTVDNPDNFENDDDRWDETQR